MQLLEKKIINIWYKNADESITKTITMNLLMKKSQLIKIRFF